MAVYTYNTDRFGVHQKILSIVGRKKQVLDVGCASGYLCRELLKQDCLVTGIEINPKAAKVAEKYCRRVIIGDIENQTTMEKLRGEKFDVLILADVLEHLKDPENVLKGIVKFLSNNGEIIISVPNIAFLTNRLLLLLGRFDYTEWGIMDRTHLRFFTKRSVMELIEACGLRLEKSDYFINFTQLPLYMKIFNSFLEKRSWWRRVEYNIGKLWPEGLAVQFLLVCKKR